MSTLPGSRIQCREDDGTLELHLPANHRGALIRSAFILLATLLAGQQVRRTRLPCRKRLLPTRT